MTLKDIAKLAGVSTSTVSRVLNQPGTKVASKAVQDRIWQIVQETGYYPNKAARSLRTQEEDDGTLPRTLVCFFARRARDFNDPFFSVLSRSLEEFAYSKKYLVKYCFSLAEVRELLRVPDKGSLRIDGGIVLGRCDEQTLHALKQLLKRLVCCGVNPFETKYDQVLCDGMELVNTCIRFLHELGHSRIGYIGEVKNEILFQGYRAALASCGLVYRQERTVHALVAGNGGFEAGQTLMQQAPDTTAIFCANDITAIGVIHALKKVGYRVPRDVSIISVDNLEMAEHTQPALTTIHIPLVEMGRLSVSLLLDQVENDRTIPVNVTAPYQLVKRASCMAAKK